MGDERAGRTRTYYVIGVVIIYIKVYSKMVDDESMNSSFNFRLRVIWINRR